MLPGARDYVSVRAQDMIAALMVRTTIVLILVLLIGAAAVAQF